MERNQVKGKAKNLHLFTFELFWLGVWLGVHLKFLYYKRPQNNREMSVKALIFIYKILKK